MQAAPAAAANLESLFLCYPEAIAPQPNLNYEHAANILQRAFQLAQQVPFVWRNIDKPGDGQVFVVFQLPAHANNLPPDGLRYLENEQRYTVQLANNRELEVLEVKYGFIPGGDQIAARVRRRFRLAKGGHPQLVLMHYTRGQSIPVPPQFMHIPARQQPPQPTAHIPAVYVMGEKAGQQVNSSATVNHPNMPHVPGIPPGPHGMGGPGHAAMLAAQNASMKEMERRRERAAAAQANRPQHPPRQQQPQQDDDSGDEHDQISARSLSLTRYKRNHELMSTVFTYATFRDRKEVLPPPPYPSPDIGEMESKIAKLTQEVEVLKKQAEERRIAREAKEAAEEVAVSTV